MGKLIEKIIETENLHWAWKKVKNCFQVGDIWYDEIELASFEADLYNKLEEIKLELKKGDYVLSTIKPLPFPKGCDIDGKSRVRQTFEISVKDQVVWMAVVNIIGNSLDYIMPWWSYGHRLYLPVWKNKDEKWELGWYTHSKGILYRKWNQSWPLFRRNVSLTAKIMCYDKFTKQDENNIDNVELDGAEQNVYNNNQLLPDHFKSKYLENDYWGQKSAKSLFWGTVDFSKFYPQIKRSVIISNILKYVDRASFDNEFVNLLKRLMDFQIDSSNWSPDELSKENGIDLNPNSFEGLPTGLFVAGFLANVALLGVDKKVSEYLNQNRDIAHFRFVDDHVILAYDFDKLQGWLKIYNNFLVEENIGAIFNYDKIEPKALSNILNPEWIGNNSNNIIKEKEQAKKDASLDPAFPAPLMTQTLAKVSAISRSDFEFLSKNEEEQLISDLEHLLLTDFPDHELRKDTRVSFAASVLSRIIPNTKVDYTLVYESQKRIHSMIKKYHKEYERSNKDFIAEKLHDLIFNRSNNIEEYSNYIKEYFFKWEEEAKDNNNKEEKIGEIKKEKYIEIDLIKKIKEQETIQKRRVYKLLIKAISENPEKVRIWSRVLDYSKNVGGCGVKDVYNKIDELKKTKIHPISVPFLHTLFMNVLSDRIMQSVFLIINKKNISQNEIEITKSFIESSFDSELLNNIFQKENEEKKSYYSKTYEYYRFVLGSTIYILEDAKFQFNIDKNIIKNYNLIDWSNNPQKWINKAQTTDINNWLYWLLWKTHDKSSSEPLDFWKKLRHHIDYTKPTFKSLILPFPNFNDLPKGNNNAIVKTILNSNFDEGWLYEILKTGKEHLTDDIKTELKEKYPNLYFRVFTDNVNLWDFIQWQNYKLLELTLEANEIKSFNIYFDPRLSEWTALEILKQIIELTETTVTDFFEDNNIEKKIHPANFIIDKKILDPKKDNISSWHEWENEIRNKISIDLDHQIDDERYTTKGLLNSQQKVGEASKIHALGVILLQLIMRKTALPWIWNSTDKSLLWESLCYRKIQESSVSSYTLLILQGCFSSENREWFSLAREKPDRKRDNSKEIPSIYDVNTLKKYIIIAQKNIKRYQLSMENNAPRQLIPISLEQLSVLNNPFENFNINLE